MSVQLPMYDPRVLSAQSTFRVVMNAMAKPGRVARLTETIEAPTPMMPATAALAQALFDHDTSIWLDAAMRDGEDIGQWLRFHTGAPLTESTAAATFALIGDVTTLPDLEAFALGSSEYPDRSTTLVVQVASLDQGSAFELCGPGIDGSILIKVVPELSHLFARLDANATTFPRGIDVVLVAGSAVMAIPRTTRLRPLEN